MRRAINLFLMHVGVALAFCLFPASSRAQPVPAEYHARVRFDIRSTRNQRVEQMLDMLRDLKKAGFVADEFAEEVLEDNGVQEITGKIESVAKAKNMLLARSVETVLLRPVGFDIPPERKERVRVELFLGTALGQPFGRQRELVDQIRGAKLLSRENFEESFGYDHQNHTRMVGTIPATQVEVLLQDLRKRGPERGWLKNPWADKLQPPLVSIWPLRLVVIMPEPKGIEPERQYVPQPVAPGEEHKLKISRDLKLLIGDKDKEDERTRIEVILAVTPAPGDRSYEDALVRAVPAANAHIEYRLGSLVALVAELKFTSDFAKLSFVTSVRLPCQATNVIPPILAKPAAEDLDLGINAKVLKSWGVNRLHQAGNRGKGVRVAVIGDDFRGYSQFLGKGLPGKTRLIDVTAERNYELVPDDVPGDPKALGAGTYQALAVATAAPEAELVLVRIGADAPYQLEMVARWITGEGTISRAFARRETELELLYVPVRRTRAKLMEERRELLNNFSDDEVTRKRREAHFKAMSKLEADEAELHVKSQRNRVYSEELRSLRGVNIVSCGLVWNDGWSVGTRSVLTRSLADNVSRSVLWLQAAGDTQGQSWAGLFADTEGNRKMNFSPSGSPRRPGRWNTELNFLSWQPHSDVAALDLPAGANIRVSIQWHEVHAPEFSPPAVSIEQDRYRKPLVNLGLLVLRQRDPSGTKLPIDYMEVIERSHDEEYRLPQRLDSNSKSAVYEQTIDFKVEKAGRYAVQVEGRVHESTRPLPDPPELERILGDSFVPETLAIAEKTWEARVRLFVQVLDSKSGAMGRPVWLDYRTSDGELGMPADSHGVLAVGAVGADGRCRGFSASGPPFNLALSRKPELFVPDGLNLGGKMGTRGTVISNGLAAGMAASALSAGWSRQHINDAWRRETKK